MKHRSRTVEEEEGKFKCPRCSKLYSRNDSLLRHLKGTHEVNHSWIICPVEDCKSASVRADRLRRHIIYGHKLDPANIINIPYSKGHISAVDLFQKYPCYYEDCTKEYSRKDHLFRHIRQSHKADPYEVVGDEFNKRPEKFFICDYPRCGVKFPSKRALQKHKKVHPSDRNNKILEPGVFFKCTFKNCDANFPMKEALQEHIQITHGEQVEDEDEIGRPVFKCTHADCDTEWKSKRCRDEHIRFAHGGIKGDKFGAPNTVKCEHEACMKEVSDSAWCKHIKIVHKGDPNERLSLDGVEAGWLTNLENDSHDEDGHEHNMKPNINAKFGDVNENNDDVLSTWEFEMNESEEEGDLEEEEGTSKCVLCCYSFNPDDESKLENFVESYQFVKFLNEILPKQTSEGSLSSEHLEGVTVCSECQLLITSAMDKKLVVDEVEIRLNNLEEKGVQDLRNLQEMLVEYCLEMMKLEEVVNGATFPAKRQQDSSIVMILRDGILTGIYELKSRIIKLESKFEAVMNEQVGAQDYYENAKASGDNGGSEDSEDGSNYRHCSDSYVIEEGCESE